MSTRKSCRLVSPNVACLSAAVAELSSFLGRCDLSSRPGASLVREEFSWGHRLTGDDLTLRDVGGRDT